MSQEPTPHASRGPSMAHVRLPRRTVLQAAALAASGSLAGGRLLAAWQGEGPAGGQATSQLATDVIDELAAALDYDVERIFRFVADEIAYEPYAGALRGALGALESGAGNSVDKASLLKALLDRAYAPATFVEGPLDDAAHEAIRDAWQVDRATLEERSGRVLTGATARGLGGSVVVAAPAEPLPPDARSIVERTEAQAGAVVARASDLLDAGIRTITGALATRGIAIPATLDDLPLLEQERHVWLRVPRGSEVLDLDPTLPGSEPGQVRATAHVEGLAAIPDDLRHRVEIRATVERIAGTALEREVVLEYVAFADEIAGLPIALSHERPDGLKGVGLGIEQMLTGAQAFQPVLQVGHNLRVGLVGLRLQGGNDEDTLLGALGAAADREGEATAEWLQVATVTPDGRRSVADRVLFDRVGDAARAAAPDIDAIAPIELAPLAPDGPPEFAPLRAIHFLAVATGGTGPQVTDALEDGDESAWPLYVVGHLYHMARDAAGSWIAPRRGVRQFHDAPNVVRYSLENVPGTTDGSFGATLDILHRSFRTAGVVGEPVARAPGIVAGVLSEVVERIAMGDTGADDGVPPADMLSVGGVLEAAAAAGIATTVLVPGDDLGDLFVGPMARSTLAAALADGWVAIGPERPVVVEGVERIGWWLFDPATGRVIDRLDDGRGIAMVDNALARYAAFLARHPYIKLGLCIGLTIKALHGLLEGMSGGNPGAFALATAGAAGALRRIACA